MQYLCSKFRGDKQRVVRLTKWMKTALKQKKTIIWAMFGSQENAYIY